MPTPLNLTNQRFDRLVVIRRVGNDRHGKSRFEVRCDCGTTKVVGGQGLRRGSSRSCGCLKSEVAAALAPSLHEANRTHSMSRSAEYTAWAQAVQRTCNPQSPNYADYGGRGIDIDPEWVGPGGFAKFIACIGPKDDPSLSLDRVNNELGYWPSNIRWADASTQMFNRRGYGKNRIERKAA